MDRSGTGSHWRQTPSISQRLRLTDHRHGVDALSNASLSSSCSSKKKGKKINLTNFFSFLKN